MSASYILNNGHYKWARIFLYAILLIKYNNHIQFLKTYSAFSILKGLKIPVFFKLVNNTYTLLAFLSVEVRWEVLCHANDRSCPRVWFTLYNHSWSIPFQTTRETVCLKASKKMPLNISEMPWIKPDYGMISWRSINLWYMIPPPVACNSTVQGQLYP